MLKTLAISERTHAELKLLAVEHGQKINALADTMIRAGLRGEAFFLPAVLRNRYASKVGKGKKNV